MAAVKHQVDVLLEEWNKSADMLFSIHPMDGSLLVWHVDWLDEYQPGMFRQAQVRARFMCFLLMSNKSVILCFMFPLKRVIKIILRNSIMETKLKQI